MALTYTDPRTWVTDEVPTAATLNTHVRDNFKAVAGITGFVDASGAVNGGTGFTCNHLGTGIYQVVFTSGFAAIPIVLVTPAQIYAEDPRACFVINPAIDTASFEVTFTNGNTGGAIDYSFYFLAHVIV